MIEWLLYHFGYEKIKYKKFSCGSCAHRKSIEPYNLLYSKCGLYKMAYLEAVPAKYCHPKPILKKDIE